MQSGIIHQRQSLSECARASYVGFEVAKRIPRAPQQQASNSLCAKAHSSSNQKYLMMTSQLSIEPWRVASAVLLSAYQQKQSFKSSF